MDSLQPSWLSALNTMNTISPSKPTLFPSTNFSISHSFKPLKQPFSVNSSNAESSEPVPPNSPESTPDAKLGAVDPVKLAFEKAKAYKKEVKSKLVSEIEQNPAEDSGVGGGTREVPVSVKVAMQKAKEYNKSKGVVSSGTKGGEGDAIPPSIFESRGIEIEREWPVFIF